MTMGACEFTVSHPVWFKRLLAEERVHESARLREFSMCVCVYGPHRTLYIRPTIVRYSWLLLYDVRPLEMAKNLFTKYRK